MNNKELQQVKRELKLTVPEFAKYLNTPVGTVKHWLSGDRRIPGSVEKLIEVLR